MSDTTNEETNRCIHSRPNRTMDLKNPDKYNDEFEHAFTPHLEHLKAEVSEPIESTISSTDTGHASVVYSLTRHLGDTSDSLTVVETGTGNGVFSLAIALGLKNSGGGRLFSIDLPFRLGEDLERHRAKTWDGFMGACIPKDKKPGWIVDEHPASMSSVRIEWWKGSVQKKLPRLPPCPREGGPKLWVFDSGHDFLTQSFELETAVAESAADGPYIFLDDNGWEGVDVADRTAEKHALNHERLPGPASLLYP